MFSKSASKETCITVKLVLLKQVLLKKVLLYSFLFCFVLFCFGEKSKNQNKIMIRTLTNFL